MSRYGALKSVRIFGIGQKSPPRLLVQSACTPWRIGLEACSFRVGGATLYSLVQASSWPNGFMPLPVQET